MTDAASATRKAELRAGIRARRRARSAGEQAVAAARLTARLLPLVAAAQTVAAYCAVDGEPSTAELIAVLREGGVCVLLPVVAGGDLDWAVDDGTYVDGPWGLREPAGVRLGVDAIARAEVVVVPALAVDVAGHRLGQGGGFYDRALLRARGRTVALVYDDEVLDVVPVEEHDVVVDAAVTPTRALSFRS
jgi:5-formyltetrahydrofolate cyclo-ligase